MIVFFLGTGFTAVPLSFLVSWAERPKAMSEDEFRREKDALINHVEMLLDKGRKLYDERLKHDAD